MKQLLIAAAVTLFISTSAAASEEIKLAEAIGGASTETAGSASGTTMAAGSAAVSTVDTVAFGAIAAASLAVVAGADSSSSH